MKLCCVCENGKKKQSNLYSFVERIISWNLRFVKKTKSVECPFSLSKFASVSVTEEILIVLGQDHERNFNTDIYWASEHFM